jgi:alkylhydroperoxidase family enzyme
MKKADVEALKKSGASDEEILEVNQVTAGFGYSNRVLNGLGVELGNEKIGLY